MKIYLFLFLTICISLTSCIGQDSSQAGYKNFTTPPSNPSIGEKVYALSKSLMIIYQAVNGDYWFGSDVHGVYRYDGKTIYHFTTKDGLSNNTIREIKEDKSGNIYFSTQHAGISKFDGQMFTTLSFAKSNSPENDWKLDPDDIWFKGVAGKTGPCRYDGDSLHHVVFPKHYLADAFYAQHPNKTWSPYDVYFIYTDKRGHVWFGTSNFGVCRYDGVSLSWLYEEHLQTVPAGGSFGIRSIIEDKEGKFWFCNTQYRYDISSGNLINNGYDLLDYKREKGIEGIQAFDGTDYVYFMSIIEDDKQHLWMATYSEGVYRYDPSTARSADKNNLTHYPVKDGAKDVTLYSIYKDNQGDLWLGTHQAGVYKFNGKSFEPFRP